MFAPARLLIAAMLFASATVHAEEIGRIGIDTASLANPFFQAIVRGVLHTARSIDPQVEVITLQHEYQPAREADNLRRLIRQRVRLLIVSAADSEAVGPLLAQARQRGIVVVAVDVAANGAQATVMTDNRLAGEIACRQLAEAMQGQGKLAIQNGPQVSSVIERVRGCKEALADFPAITVVGEELNGQASPKGGQLATQALLRSHPDVLGIFTINDRQALGTSSALRAAQRADVLIASVDGSPAFAEALEQDRNLLASATQDPYQMASQAVRIGTDLLAGRPTSNGITLIRPELLRRDNRAQYHGWLGHPDY